MLVEVRPPTQVLNQAKRSAFSPTVTGNRSSVRGRTALTVLEWAFTMVQQKHFLTDFGDFTFYTLDSVGAVRPGRNRHRNDEKCLILVAAVGLLVLMRPRNFSDCELDFEKS